VSTDAVSPSTGQYCGRCGRPVTETTHEGCAAGLELEPPRFCPHCARRMVVQVLPTGWTARCSRHGSVNARSAGSEV
jgi:hypothetical protein